MMTVSVTMIALYVIYGLLLMGGGIMGYAKAKSRASLISGLITGALALIGAWVYSCVPLTEDLKPDAAARVLRDGGAYTRIATVMIGEAFLAGIVAAIFIGRYFKTKKAMPAIPIIVLSAVVIIASIAPLTGRH